MVPFDDSPEPRQDSSLVSTTPDNKRTSLLIGGLDVVADDIIEEEEKKKKKKRSTTKRKRRRRRVEIDNGKIELDSAEIKDMLQDTSDIVRQNRVHPADYIEDENEQTSIRPWKRHRGLYAELVAQLPYERLIARPNIADNGTLAPELLQLWDRNASRLRGEPLPFLMRGESGEDQRIQLAEEAIHEAAEKEEDIEMARNQKVNEDTDDLRLSTDFADQGVMDEEEFPNADEDMVTEFIEEEENFATEQEGVPFEDDVIQMASPANSENSHRSSFSLGAVNDLEADISGERQEISDSFADSGSKWHKHTVRVFNMLKTNIATDEEVDDLPNDLSFQKISDGVSRQTACGVFFELLQLKTWDFIELNQEKSYGDITITSGTRFNENPPVE